MKRALYDQLSELQRTGLEKYESELKIWNRRFSLTSIPDEEIFIRLIAPSVWLALQLSQHPPGLIADFGSGPGIPGMPMALIDKSQKFLLIESNGKRAGFMRHAKTLLGLSSVNLFHGRLTNKDQLQGVDLVVSRAAGEIVDVMGILPGVSHGIFFKGSDSGEEISNAREAYENVSINILKTPDWFGNLKVIEVKLFHVKH